ncbi:ABC transporter permease subunit [Desulfosarcina sp. OttesenSCG-928-G17]|nr:ABC transporter permease subunit [Desulfosarcina sp. OttesenSCG-928-G17]
MTAYFIRRFLLIIPTFLGITVLIFVITRFVPGGPIERIIAQAQQQAISGGRILASETAQRQPLSDDQIELLKRYYGLDKPVLTSYFLWLGKLMRGDLGVSTRYHDPVWEMIRERIPISLYFGMLTLVATYGICIPLGIAKAIRHNSVFDNVSSILVFVGYAVPGWVMGILMILVFSSHWEWFPLGGLVSENFDAMSVSQKITDLAWHSVLPLLAYLIGAFSLMTFLMKNTLMDTLAADYVRTAMAKGLSFRKAVFGHALRNSLIPIATTFGSNLGVVLSGSFLVEKVFNIDGMGLLGYEAVVERDYPVVLGVLAISSILFLLGNVISDMCVAAVDPRITFD